MSDAGESAPPPQPPEGIPPADPADPFAVAADPTAAGTTSQPGHPRRIVAQRYELHELLGTGGMGRVFRAQDTRLKRWIAIKLLIGAGPEASKRLLTEAQAQARVEHPHVCRVYEVGWDEEGEPFIVMQLISGDALSDVTPRLTFEQRARLVQQVAEAVHAANRLGVIHRDLKPGNVLVEKNPDGEHRAYVTDFGLARDAAEKVTASPGSVVGTPNYMAPEQARGDTARIDRRTDVYGLGATLYEVLSGKLPFDGNAYDVLTQVTKNDPRPLLKLDPNIPHDLAAISRKCMEKDPQQRYDSARAMAEDLQRWLDGAPILAEPPSLAYRTKRFIQRHRTLSIATAAALIVAIGGGVWAVRARGRAREMAERFGQDVKEIEGRMRFAQVLPLHDISDEENDVRERMARIQREMRPLGKEGLGPGEYALGRGALALGEADWARSHFQRAWDAGYQEPETATGLGLSLVALYRSGLQEANRLTDKKLREHRREALAQLYRAPAKNALLAGAGATTEPAEYVEALIRFCDDDFDGAERVARDALLQAPWLYEARILLGQIHRERGLRHRANGDDGGAAIEFALAEEPLKIATEFGRSDPRAWGELCALQLDQLELRFDRGGTLDAAPKSLFESCQSAVDAAPDRAGSSAALAEAQRAWGEMQLRDGIDPHLALTAAEVAVKHALALKPGDADAGLELGSILRLSAIARRMRGEDPNALLDQAISALDQARASRPQSVPIAIALAQALTDQAHHLFEQGKNPQLPLARALELLALAQSLDPDTVEPHSGLGRARLLQARIAVSKKEDPTPLIDQAIAELTMVAGANQAPLEYVSLASAYAQRAETEEAAGTDPSAAAQSALAALGKSSTGDRHWPAALLIEARAQAAMARARLHDNDDPDGFVQLARAAYSDAIRNGRNDGEVKRVGAELDKLEEEAKAQPHRKPAAGEK